MTKLCCFKKKYQACFDRVIKRHILFLLTSILVGHATAIGQTQNDSLKTVEITASNNTILRQNNADFYTNLSRNTDITLKQYGINNIANLRLRGLSAEQTAIEWNGMPIQSATLGQMDISLLPTTGWSSVQLKEHANGGTLSLKSSHNKPQRAAAAAYNSANNYEGNLAFGGWLVQKKVLVQSNIYGNYHQNRFYFQPYGNGKPVVLPHALQKTYGAMLDFTATLGDSTTLKIASWTHRSLRDLPPTLSEYNDEKKSQRVQGDFAQRTALTYNFWDKQATTTLGHTYENLMYSDSLTRLFAESQTERFFVCQGIHIRPDANKRRIWGIESSVNYRYDIGTTGTYRSKTQQNGDLKTMLNLHFAPHWRLWLQHVNTMYDAQVFFDPLQYGGGLDFYRSNTKMGFDAHISHQKSRRLPTLNERFWQPGGNPNLLPETVTGSDATLHFIWRQPNQNTFDVTVKGFWIRNEAHIQWLPQNGIWQPQNVGLVWSRGGSLSLKTHLNDVFWHQFAQDISVNYTYTRTTNPLTQPDVQSIYIPQHQANFIAVTMFRQWSVTNHVNFVGHRNTTTDGREYLGAYLLYDAGVSYQPRPSGTNQWGFDVTLHNITNTNYQVTQNYAQALRFVSVGMRCKF